MAHGTPVRTPPLGGSGSKRPTLDNTRACAQDDVADEEEATKPSWVRLGKVKPDEGTQLYHRKLEAAMAAKAAGTSRVVFTDEEWAEYGIRVRRGQAPAPAASPHPSRVHALLPIPRARAAPSTASWRTPTAR